MFLDKLSPKEKTGLTIAAVFLLAALMDRVLISPLRHRIENLDLQIQIAEKELGRNLRNIHQKDEIEKEYDRYLPYVTRAGSDEEEVAKILGEIEALARRSSVSISDMKPRDPKTEDFYKMYVVELEAEGELDQTIRFLQYVNTSKQLLRVEKMGVKAAKEGDSRAKISMTITKALLL